MLCGVKVGWTEPQTKAGCETEELCEVQRGIVAKKLIMYLAVKWKKITKRFTRFTGWSIRENGHCIWPVSSKSWTSELEAERLKCNALCKRIPKPATETDKMKAEIREKEKGKGTANGDHHRWQGDLQPVAGESQLYISDMLPATGCRSPCQRCMRNMTIYRNSQATFSRFLKKQSLT